MAVAGWERVRGVTITEAVRTLHFAVVFDLLPLMLDALYGLRKSTVVLVLGFEFVPGLCSIDGLCVVMSVVSWRFVDRCLQLRQGHVVKLKGSCPL